MSAIDDDDSMLLEKDCSIEVHSPVRISKEVRTEPLKSFISIRDSFTPALKMLLKLFEKHKVPLPKKVSNKTMFNKTNYSMMETEKNNDTKKPRRNTEAPKDSLKDKN